MNNQYALTVYAKLRALMAALPRCGWPNCKRHATIHTSEGRFRCEEHSKLPEDEQLFGFCADEIAEAQKILSQPAPEAWTPSDAEVERLAVIGLEALESAAGHTYQNMYGVHWMAAVRAIITEIPTQVLGKDSKLREVVQQVVDEIRGSGPFQRLWANRLAAALDADGKEEVVETHFIMWVVNRPPRRIMIDGSMWANGDVDSVWFDADAAYARSQELNAERPRNGAASVTPTRVEGPATSSHLAAADYCESVGMSNVALWLKAVAAKKASVT